MNIVISLTSCRWQGIKSKRHTTLQQASYLYFRRAARILFTYVEGGLLSQKKSARISLCIVGRALSLPSLITPLLRGGTFGKADLNFGPQGIAYVGNAPTLGLYPTLQFLPP